MKKLLLILALGAFVSCQQKTKEAKNDAPKDSTAIALNPTMGALQTKTFEGVLPAQGKGLRYTLTVKKQEKSEEGTYELLRTYIEGNEGKDITYGSEGKITTIHGIKSDKNALVWQLTPKTGKEISYYLVQDDCIIMLSQEMTKTSSWKDYVLKFKK